MIDKATLLAPRLPEAAEFEIVGVGVVRVRGLTRAEALRVSAAGIEEADAIALAAGLVEPAITVDEARQLLATSPAGELDGLVVEIMERSGMTEGARKSVGTVPDAGRGRSNGVHAGTRAGADPG